LLFILKFKCLIKWPLIFSVCRNRNSSVSHSRLSIGCVTRLKRPVPHVEQALLALPGQIHILPVFSEVRVTRSLVLYICLSFCTFSVGHCVVCSSSIYGFWLPPLLYLQTLLVPLTVALSVLPLTAYDCLPCGIFKLFLSFWLLYYMSVFHWRLMIVSPVVSSNFPLILFACNINCVKPTIYEQCMLDIKFML